MGRGNYILDGVDDAKRAAEAVKGITGKRLTYRRTHGGTEA